MHTEPCLIGIDIGTTSVKAALINACGEWLDSWSDSYPTHNPGVGQIEQDPADWWTRVLFALERFAAHANAADVMAIGVCSQVNTHVFTASDGSVLGRAMTWQDTRAAAEAAELDALLDDTQRLHWWGAPMPIDASHGLSRLLWLARNDPERYARTSQLLLPKDYCVAQLTGATATDPLSAIGLVDLELRYIDELLSLVPGARLRMPELASDDEVIGCVSEGLPFARTPVVCGAMDAWSGMIGLGCVDEGRSFYLSGTSEILGIVSSRCSPTAGVIVFPRCHDITLHAGPTQAGASSLVWLSSVLQQSIERLLQHAAHCEQTDVLFLPHLQGERAPVWDPHSRGTFTGMTSSTGVAELTRAVLAGGAYSARWIDETLQRSAMLSALGTTIGGGGARSDLWCQIRADVFGRSMQRVRYFDAGVTGAAILAATGTGLHDSLQHSAAMMLRIDREFAADPAMAEHHRRRFQRYQTLYRALQPLHAPEHG